MRNCEGGGKERVQPVEKVGQRLQIPESEGFTKKIVSSFEQALQGVQLRGKHSPIVDLFVAPNNKL